MSGLFPSIVSPPLAQAAEAGQAAEGTLSPLAVLLIQFGPVLLLAFFLFFWLPMRNQRRRVDMINALKRNDRVVTESGIYGTVLSIDAEADRIVLRIDDEKGVKLTCRKSSVVGVVDAAPADKEKAGPAEKKAS